MHAYTQTRCVHKPETDAQVQDTDQSRHNHTLSHLQKHTCGFHNCTHLSVWANHVEEQRMKDSIFCRVAIHNYERSCNTTRLAATWGRACVRVCQDWGPYKERMDKTFQSLCACAFRARTHSLSLGSTELNPSRYAELNPSQSWGAQPAHARTRARTHTHTVCVCVCVCTNICLYI